MRASIKCLLTCHYSLEYGMLIMFRIDTDKFCGMNIEKETCLTIRRRLGLYIKSVLKNN